MTREAQKPTKIPPVPVPRLAEQVRAGMTLPHLSPKARAALEELVILAGESWWRRLLRSVPGFGGTPDADEPIRTANGRSEGVPGSVTPGEPGTV